MSIPKKAVLRLSFGFILVVSLGVWLWLSWLERSFREEPYSLIEDGLYLGSSVPEPPPGTKAVLNLCGRKDSYAVDSVLWEPILAGGTDPDLAWLGGWSSALSFMKAQQNGAAFPGAIRTRADMWQLGTFFFEFVLASPPPSSYHQSVRFKGAYQ